MKPNISPPWHARKALALLILAASLLCTAGGGCLAAGQAESSLVLPAVPELPQTPEAIDKVMQLEADGQKLLEKGDIDKALAKVQEAYAMSLEMKYSDGQGRCLTLMCEIYLSRNQVSKAKELGENAIEVLSASANTKALSQARVALAQAYFALDNPLWAANQLDLALKGFTQFGLNDSAEAARVMLISGNVIFKMGKLKEAIQFYQGAAIYSEQSGNHEQSVAIRIKLASVMRELGWFVAALEEAQKAVDEARQMKDKALLPAALASTAIAQYNLGEFAAARSSYEELLYLKSPNHLAVARLQAGYGHTLAATGERQAAISELEAALKVVKTKGSTIEQTQILNTLGCIQEMEGHQHEAAKLLLQSLEIGALAQPRQDRMTLMILQNLAAVEFRSGSFQNARNHLLSCFPILKKSKNTIMEGRIYACLGEVCLKLQDAQEAVKYLQAGIAVSSKINDDSALWRDYTNLAGLELAQGQTGPAKEALSSAVSYFRSPQAGWFACPETLGFPTTREDLGERLVSLMVSAGQLDQALLAAEQLKEESFINEWLHKGGDIKPADKDIYNDLVAQRAHLHAAEAISTPDKLLKDWQNWMSRFRQVSSTNKPLARLIAPLPNSFNDILKAVKASHATVIDYLTGADGTVVFTIDNDRLAALSLPVTRSVLQSQVNTLLAGQSKPNSQAERRILRSLYQELLPHEVMAVLPASADQTVVIQPDGVLFNLPFAALIDQSGKFLVENYTLTMASSMGIFIDSPPPYSHDVSLIVASEPAPAGRIPAEDESRQITSLFQPDLVTQLIGKEAEVSNLQEQVKIRSVLHFTSKLSLADGNPRRAILPLVWSSEDSKEKSTKATANRLFGLNLPSDLVVWSGTSVSSADLNGNAVKLFSRGLSYAGVRNVLMSLWIEPDAERTSEIMDFYKGEQKGLNQAQSLRKAQLLALSKNSSFHSWAAFQLLGPGY